MSVATAELTLIFKAQNLATSAVNDLKTGLDAVGTKAASAASKITSAFKGLGRIAGVALGNFAQDILNGQNFQTSLAYLGATLAGYAVEGFAVEFAPKIAAKIAAVPAVQAVIGAVSGAGTAIGSSLATAIGLGVSVLLPGVLIAAVLAASQNPQLRAEIDGIWNRSLSDVISGKHPDTSGPGFHAPSGDFLQKLFGGAGRSAAGGWVGMNGPELRLVGEQGPEYVRRNGTGTGDSGGTGFTIQGVSEQQILDMVDRGLYFRLRRAAPTAGRI